MNKNDKDIDYNTWGESWMDQYFSSCVRVYARGKNEWLPYPPTSQSNGLQSFNFLIFFILPFPFISTKGHFRRTQNIYIGILWSTQPRNSIT